MLQIRVGGSPCPGVKLSLACDHPRWLLALVPLGGPVLPIYLLVSHLTCAIKTNMEAIVEATASHEDVAHLDNLLNTVESLTWAPLQSNHTQ